jgi:hypothetical protein
MPQLIFDKIPTITYDDMLVVHPHWQMMNQHRAFAYPVTGAPKEAIFERMKKDNERFAKLYSHYPLTLIPTEQKIYQLPLITHLKQDEVIIYGFAAYAILYTEYQNLLVTSKLTSKLKPLTDILELHVNKPSAIDKQTTYDTPIVVQDYIINDITDDIRNVSEQHNPIADYQLVTYQSTLTSEPKSKPANKSANEYPIIVHYLSETLLPISIVDIHGKKYKVTNVYAVLLYLLLGYHLSDKSTLIYQNYYVSLLSMLRHVSDIMNDMIKDDPKEAKKIIDVSPFFVSPDILYGKSNMSQSSEIMWRNEYRRYCGVMGKPVPPQPNIPTNYYPAKGKPPPIYDYTSSYYFKLDGVISTTMK